MIEDMRVSALVLAAGYANRMGDLKPLLPLGDSTVIERAVRCFLEAGVRDVKVVVGHRAVEITPILARLGVQAVFNARYDVGMYASVRAGVSSLDVGAEAFFLLPGDSPLVKPRTILELLRAWRENQVRIVYPCFLGTRGHPPLISTTCKEVILSGEWPGGLRAVLAQYEDDALDQAVVDQGVLVDLDAPADYHAALAYVSREDIPTRDECLAILDRHEVPQPVIAHSQVVTNVARKLATKLKAAGLDLNLALVVAGGLLHDLAKGQPNHAYAGAQELRDLGCPRVAEIVATHIDIGLERPLNEAQVVYLADKVTRGTCLVSLADRYRAALARFAGQSEVLDAVRDRFRRAEGIKGRIESVLGLSLEQTLSEETLEETSSEDKSRPPRFL
jgi:molybdenum cofactor cytidylyltransferase